MTSQRVRRNRTILVAALVVITVVIIIWVVSCSTSKKQSATTAMPVTAPVPPASQKFTEALVRATPLAEVAESEWVTKTAQATGIPRRALAAYAGGAIRLSLTWPECGVTWNTLAGIGWIESHHGELYGAHIDDNGNMTEPIFGQPLVGDGTMNIPDFDNGNFDGDPLHDRAVGPMQILPQTWAAWHANGNLDDNEDGQNIDDSVVAAANYLCYSSDTMTTPEGWRKSLWSYNQLDTYANDVMAKANDYAAAIGVR